MECGKFLTVGALLFNAGSVDPPPAMSPEMPVELTLYHRESCSKERLSWHHATWLYYAGPVKIDIDRWTQVKISSGLISLASQSGFLRQAERRQRHTRLLFREGI